MKFQAGIKISRRNINNLRYSGDTTLMAEEIKSLLMRVKEESEKAGLKFNSKKTKITVCYPITLWQIEGKKGESSNRFYFGGLKITADGDCSHEIKRQLLIRRKAMINLNSILKSRDVKAMVFPVVTYGCETWTIKKAELQRIDAFELWCWRRLWRFLWITKRSNQSILKEMNPEYSLEGLLLKLKLQYFVYLM